MSEEQLKELQEYNLEYLEAQASEEMFGGDFTSAVELKQAKQEIERLNRLLSIETKYRKYFDKANQRLEKIIKILEKEYKNVLTGHMGLDDEEASEYIKEEIKEGLEEICNDNK